MISANELRRGNWVKWDNADIFYKIESINENTGSEEDPIPLTPEILEKAGFVEVGDGYFGGKKYIFSQFSFDFAGGHLDLSECIEGNYVNRKNIEYVHQLQNLYFALTGEELPIEL